MNWTSWCVKEGILSLCKCQGNEEKFRVDGMAGGRSRIQKVGSLECPSGETCGHKGSNGEEAIRANAHGDQAGI